MAGAAAVFGSFLSFGLADHIQLIQERVYLLFWVLAGRFLIIVALLIFRRAFRGLLLAVIINALVDSLTKLLQLFFF